MDTYEATRIVLTRIQNLDPENASKIMGVLLIQDHGEKEMIRLAFGPESLLQSVVLKARQDLGLCNSPSTPRPLPWSPNINSPIYNNNTTTTTTTTNTTNTTNTTTSNSNHININTDLIDELALHEQLSFLDEGPNGGGFVYGSDESTCGFGWKPCLYYARGYCKNGSSCRFLHRGDLAGTEGVEAAVAKRGLAASFPYSGSGLGPMGLLLQQQQQTDSQRATAALMLGDEMHKLGRPRYDRNDFCMSPGSRQIYLTFPADSTFREEDVSNYFSIYGPVQDVRIPYQQKRMFGFVTFVYPETVKLILAKGNPHFVCDARVLVKPYKEKGKIPDKFRKQQMERGDFSCGSPTGLDSRADPFDLPLGRMFGNGNGQEILWRRKLEEQAELQQAIELQGRRLMSLQLLDVKRHHHHHLTRSLSNGSAIASPTHSPSFFNQSLVLPSDRTSPDSVIENGFHLSNSAMPVSASVVTDQESKSAANLNNEKEKEIESPPAVKGTLIINGNGNGNGDDSPTKKDQENDLPESLEHNLNLPDSPFASPKSSRAITTTFNPTIEAEKSISVPGLSSGLISGSSANSSLITSALLPASSTLDVASFNSCYFHVPRFSSGPGAIGM